MALTPSGQLALSEIATELSLGATNNSLRNMSASASFSSPDAVSDFYSYSALLPPTSVQATTAGSSDINITWVASSGATGYKIYVSSTFDGSYTLDGTDTASPYNDTGLAPETEYFYKVSATNAGGESAQSDWVSAITDPICFVAGTMITLSNGVQISIENLLETMVVESALIDTLQDTNVVRELYNWKSADIKTTKVSSIISKIYSKLINETIVINNGLLEATPQHTQLIQRDGIWTFVQIQDIKIGDNLIDRDENIIPVIDTYRNYQEQLVYPLTLQEPHTFYANNILTHNVK